MKLTTFEQLGRRGTAAVWGVMVAGLLLVAGTVALGDVHPDAKRNADARRQGLELFASAIVDLNVNQLACGINTVGDVCTNAFDSPVDPGGFWPAGSQNAYIFNTGLQIAGIMAGDGGPWAGDTVGAYFFDARGTGANGAPLGDGIYNSLDPDDAANWPTEALVTDADLFNDALVNQQPPLVAASQQDSWVQYWDGDPAQGAASRAHPMGIRVTQRSMAWNYPAGNESIIYFLYSFENVTAEAEFQRLSENGYFGGADALPDGGITLTEMYAAFSTDMDVADAGSNFSTAVLPFDIGLSYEGGFSAPSFSYPPEIFFPPFFTNAPGIVGVKYLRSPVSPVTGEEVGLTLFSATLNSATGFPDPEGDKQLWRYLSGNLNPAAGDFPCSVTPEIVADDAADTERSVCFLSQSADDTRFYQASGPFQMAPGDEATIVVAYIVAPTVRTLPDGSASGIIANSDPNTNNPGEPSFHPGFPSARGCTNANDVPGSCSEVDNANPVKAIEHGAGWVSYDGPPPASALENPANKLSQDDVTVVPGSLLGRSLVAQEIFDAKFLLGFAPAQPVFHLVPGNNSVTVVWDPSATEDDSNPSGGDPFAQVATDPNSALFNPNYRQFDVEGYRVWRGTSSGTLNLIAQFDYANTTYTDLNCETVAPDEDVGAFTVDEITGDTVPAGAGFSLGEICPDDFSREVDIAPSLVFNNGSEGAQPGAGVLRLADGTAVYSGEPITAIASDESGDFPALANTGVPFVYTDDDVTNNFTYFYAVSAFDINSPASGPHSLRSARVTKMVIPRADAPNLSTAFSFSVDVVGDDGQPLDTAADAVQPNPATGIFPAPQPPTNATEVFFSPDPSGVGKLLETGVVSVTIDSIVPRATAVHPCTAGSNARGMCWQAYLSTAAGGQVTQSVIDGETPFSNVTFGEASELNLEMGSGTIPFSNQELQRFGIPDGFGEGVAVGVRGAFNVAIANSATEALVNRFSEVDLSEPGGSRWFDGDTETLEHPTIFTKAGELAGIDTIFHPISHTDLGAGEIAPASGDMVCWPYTMAFLTRAADVRFTWGSGTFESVRDVTHNVDVPFASSPRTTWGFMTEDANGNGVLDWQDFDYLDGINQNTSVGGTLDFFCALGDRGLVNPPIAQLTQSLDGVVPVSTEGIQPEDMAPTGMGFGLYVNGEHYIFETSTMPSAGTEWTLRSYHGYIQADDPFTTAPSNYRLVTDDGGATPARPPMVAGLSIEVTIDQAGAKVEGVADLERVHTVPDPYLGSSQYDRAPTSKALMFVNLPPEATIRIYTLTGVLVDVLVHDDPTGGGRAEWDVRSRNNQFVASGVYFFHVVTPNGNERVGKFTIVNQTGAN